MLYGVDALTCSICQNFSHKSKYTLQNHIESKHFPNTFVYSCPKCQKNVSTREALICHKKRCSSYWCWMFLFKVKLRSPRTSMCMWRETKQLANHRAPSVKSSPITPWAMCVTILKADIFQIHSLTPVESAQQYLEPSMLLTCINEHIENMSSSLWINLSRILVFTCPILGVVQSPEDLKQYIVPGENGPSCGLCHSFSHHSRTNVLRHIESKHFPNAFLYQCSGCGASKKTKTALERHMPMCLTRM